MPIPDKFRRSRFIRYLRGLLYVRPTVGYGMVEKSSELHQLGLLLSIPDSTRFDYAGYLAARPSGHQISAGKNGGENQASGTWLTR